MITRRHLLAATGGFALAAAGSYRCTDAGTDCANTAEE